MPLKWDENKVIVTGGAGFLGRSVCTQLRDRGCRRIFVPRRADYDLTEPDACRRCFEDAFDGERPDCVIHLAAEVGGIGANRAHPGRFFYANMAMALNLIEQCRRSGLHEHGGRFFMTGSICAYPKNTPVPFREPELWNGYPEETNGPYGVAKKAAGVMLDAYCREYGMRGAYGLVVNLYGPHDNFDPESSHVIPALIRKCVDARDRGDDHILCWGTGSATREFLYVDDAAAGILALTEHVDEPIPINLGASEEISIRDLVGLIARLAGFEGEIRWDATMPDGQPRRCVDPGLARERTGWSASTPLEEGLARTIAWYEANRTS